MPLSDEGSHVLCAGPDDDEDGCAGDVQPWQGTSTTKDAGFKGQQVCVIDTIVNE